MDTVVKSMLDEEAEEEKKVVVYKITYAGLFVEY